MVMMMISYTNQGQIHTTLTLHSKPPSCLTQTTAMLLSHLLTSTLAPYNLLLIYPSGGPFRSVKRIVAGPYEGFQNFSSRALHDLAPGNSSDPIAHYFPALVFSQDLEHSKLILMTGLLHLLFPCLKELLPVL